MFTLDMPNEPPSLPVMVVAQAAPEQVKRSGKMRAMGICWPVRSNTGTPLEYSPKGRPLIEFISDEIMPIGPVDEAESYFFHYENGKRVGHYEGGKRLDPTPDSAVKVIAPPKHGKLFELEGDPYYYRSDLGYVGDDKVIFEVMVEGMPVRVVMLLKIRENVVTDAQYNEYCKVDRWKISTAPAATPEYTFSTVVAGLLDIAAPLVADLPGLATGQTIGGQITLDTTAAGYTWYIDFTPLDNRPVGWVE